jgi:hypothetical protein
MGTIFVTFVVYAVVTAVWLVGTRSARQSIGWSFIWVLMATWIFLLSAFRVGGSDWENYDWLYFYVSRAGGLFDAIQENFIYEPLYIALNYLFTLFSPERRALVIFESAINAIAVYLIVSRSRGGPILLIWLFPLQFANILGVRQNFAASIVLIALLSWPHRHAVKILLISAPFFHLSAIIFYVGYRLRTISIASRQSLVIIGVLVLTFAASWQMIYEKFGNYLDNSEDLTNISSTQLVFGRLTSLAVLFSLAVLAKRAATDKTAGINPILAAVAITSALSAFIVPALARISTPLEFMVAWQCANVLSHTKKYKIRMALFFILVVFAGIKMVKIYYQTDIYEACFFCA